MEKNEMKEVFREVLSEGVFVSQETHEAHHRWIESAIRRSDQCMENRRRITVVVIGAIIVSTLGWVVSLAFEGFRLGLAS